ncbi:hypothetical protein [Frondihabitans sucicola]|nr:hypothetical protein [Frondihabitans sucicola]
MVDGGAGAPVEVCSETVSAGFFSRRVEFDPRQGNRIERSAVEGSSPGSTKTPSYCRAANSRKWPVIVVGSYVVVVVVRS